MSKKKANNNGIVFSTNPDFTWEHNESPESETLPPAKQRLKIRLDTKQRAGKAVTLVEGFSGKQDDLEHLGKQLKTFCGTGGAVKDNSIMVQGDQRDKVLQWLTGKGYTSSKKI